MADDGLDGDLRRDECRRAVDESLCLLLELFVGRVWEDEWDEPVTAGELPADGMGDRDKRQPRAVAARQSDRPLEGVLG